MPGKMEEPATMERRSERREKDGRAAVMAWEGPGIQSQWRNSLLPKRVRTKAARAGRSGWVSPGESTDARQAARKARASLVSSSEGGRPRLRR